MKANAISLDVGGGRRVVRLLDHHFAAPGLDLEPCRRRICRCFASSRRWHRSLRGSGPKIGNPALPSVSIPVTWGDLNLSGKLVFMNSVQSANSLSMSIKALDLSHAARSPPSSRLRTRRGSIS